MRESESERERERKRKKERKRESRILREVEVEDHEDRGHMAVTSLTYYLALHSVQLQGGLLVRDNRNRKSKKLHASI